MEQTSHLGCTSYLGHRNCGLDVFDEKEINAHFTVMNFELKNDRGKEMIRFAEDKLKLVVNRAKSRAAPLKSCFLSPSP